MIDSKVSVTVPSTVNVGQQASQIMVDAVVDQTLQTLSELFGGATAIPAKGAYVAEDGTLIKEDVIVVEALCEKQDAHFRADEVMDLQPHSLVHDMIATTIISFKVSSIS